MKDNQKKAYRTVQIRSGSEETRSVYKNRIWKMTRERVIHRDLGICQRCHKPIRGHMIVDHIIELTPENYKNKDIAYGLDNLQLLCHKCHSEKTVEYQTQEVEIKDVDINNILENRSKQMDMF